MRCCQGRAAWLRAIWIGASIAAAQVDVPSEEDFRRSWRQAIAVLGDYVYIEGGELAQYVDGEENEPYWRPINVTLTVPLNSSWSLADVTFGQIDRGQKPIIKDGTLWAHEEGDRLFQWDGEGAWGDLRSARDRRLYVLEANGEGGGAWSTQESRNDRTRGELTRVVGTAHAVCGQTVYAVGGVAAGPSDARIEGEGFPVRGMVSFDMEELVWANESIASMAPDGSYSFGRADCVTGLGDGDLVVTAGGTTTGPVSPFDGDPIDTNNITFYDTKSKKWMWQQTSGSSPRGRWDHCIAGAASTNGTYEIFVYGGRNNVESDLDDIWILTLPGFHWFRVDVESTPRYQHVCAVVGNRQMFVSGGPDADGDDDTWRYGLGIFDMTALSWSDGYDADADEYESPEVVKKWYRDGGMDDVSWSSDEVEELFASFSSSSDPSDSSSSPTPSSSSSDSSSGSSSTPVAAIAGGTVGGVAALALVGLLVFCLRRRRKKRRSVHEVAGQPAVTQPLQGGYGGGAGGPQQAYAAELPTNEQRSELDGYYAPQTAPKR